MKYVENFEEKLDRYAEIIVKIGANVQKGQKVWVNCTTGSLPLVYKIVEKSYKMGASDVNVKLNDDRLTRLHAEYKSLEVYSSIPKWAVDRWKRQMQTPYNDLSEEEKESDRKEADGMIAILTK